MNRSIYSGIGSFAQGGSVPRQTMIADQEHMLAYITPAEALMLQEAGGSGLPGPAGIPTFAPAVFRDGRRVDDDVIAQERANAAAENERKAAAGEFRGEVFGDIDGDGRADSFRSMMTDIFDGGGAGYSGSRFMRRGGGNFDSNEDGYISENEYRDADPRDIYESSNILSRLSQGIGARPRGSYASERALGSDGRNIGTSGIANFLTQGGALQYLGENSPTRFSRAVPTMGLNVPLTRATQRPQLRPENLGSPTLSQSPSEELGLTDAQILRDTIAGRYLAP